MQDKIEYIRTGDAYYGYFLPSPIPLELERVTEPSNLEVNISDLFEMWLEFMDTPTTLPDLPMPWQNLEEPISLNLPLPWECDRLP